MVHRSWFTAILLIVLFTGGFLYDCVILAAVREDAHSLVNGSFDFKREILGNISSLAVSVENINNNTGEVTLNGADTKSPTIPFTWDWDDGNVTTGWFPQTHTYFDKTRNYIVKVTSHYTDGETDIAEVLVRFVPPCIIPTTLPSDIAVLVPSHPVNLTSRLPGYGIPESLTYFDDSFFGVINRSVVEYLLTAAASIQKDFANDNICLIDGGFRQVLLRDPSSGGCVVSGTLARSALLPEIMHFKDQFSGLQFSTKWDTMRL